MNFKQLHKKANKGYTTLMTVLIISVVLTTLLVSLMSISILSVQNTQSLVEGAQARLFANACGEIALNSFKEDIEYDGNETINFSDGSCEIDSTTINGTTIILRTTGISGSSTRHVEIEINQVSANVYESYWQEVP